MWPNPGCNTCAGSRGSCGQFPVAAPRGHWLPPGSQQHWTAPCREQPRIVLEGCGCGAGQRLGHCWGCSASLLPCAGAAAGSPKPCAPVALPTRCKEMSEQRAAAAEPSCRGLGAAGRGGGENLAARKHPSAPRRGGRINNTCRGIQRSLLATSEIVQQHNFLMMGNDETSISNLFFCLVPEAAASGSAQATGCLDPYGWSRCLLVFAVWVSRSSKLKIASKWAQFDCFNASRENTRNVEILK